MEVEGCVYVFSNSHNASFLWRDLMQQVDVRNRVLDVTGEVCDLATTVRSRKVVVHPPDEDFLWGEAHKFFQCLTLVQECCKVGILVQVNITEQTNLKKYKKSFILELQYCNNARVQEGNR